MSEPEAPVEEPYGGSEPRELADEMRTSYLDYAMSVIVGRALPDVRDGLKPVHRRVLYAMDELGLQPGRPHVKCAKVVGETMGTYHPHGDQAIYDTLVRMAQPFSSRALLVDGQGNFGNVDGFSAAAMRYTECRLSRVATLMLRDIDTDTVDFGPNYDGSREQPLVLPARFPNLLVNGSAGIAVGMATNIPPHNLAEAVNATIAMVRNPDVTLDELMGLMPGPDFPTGGVIMGTAGIRAAYATGRGKIRLRARTDIEELPNGRSAIVVSELPFTVKKGGDEGVIAKIAELAVEKVVPEIADVKDHSSDEGMRIVIELRKDAVATVVLNKLFKHTQLQVTFGANMVSLVDGVPRTLGVQDMLRHYIAHQRDVIVRRTKFQLDRAERRCHILDGYLIALGDLDAVIQLIRSSKDQEQARQNLQSEFGMSEVQAQAIVDLRLGRLTGLEQDAIRAEHAELTAKIAELRAILANESRVSEVIVEELEAIAGEFADERRSEITPIDGEIDIEELIADEEMVVTITHGGYVKRLPVGTYRAQRRGGVGVRGMQTKDDDWIEHLFTASTHDYVLFFTSYGKVYRAKAYELPLGTREARGRALVNVLALQEGEKVMAAFTTRDYSEGRYLVFGTRRGVVKKTEFLAYNTVLKTTGIIAINLREGDELVDVRLTDGDDRILLVSKGGQAALFSEQRVRPMGRSASGVTGMKLAVDDEVIALRVPGPEDDVLVITDGGYGKRTPITEYRETGRGAKGVRTISAKAEADRGPLVAAHCVTGEEDLIVTTAGGIVTRMSVGEVRSMGRSTSGVRIQRIKGEEDRVSSCAIVPAEEDVPEDEAVPPKAEAEVKDAVEVPPQADAAEAEALADAADGDPGDDQEIGPTGDDDEA
ncbi:MAG: DNA gyrase subunit A [Actinobacteria bacterium]|nr:DNA gyrase subunit A [Actinomycetota bacterium]